MWIIFSVAYGILKGMRDVIKKLALKKSSTIEVLFFYTFLSFVFVLPWTGDAVRIFDGNAHYLALIAVKSFVIYIAWICSFKAIEHLPIGFYGLMDMSRVIITSVLSILFLGEVMTLDKAIGMVLVLDGLLLVNLTKKGGGAEGIPVKYTALVLVSCLMNSCSEIFDKWFMRPETGITTGQLQFWYLFFLTAMYFLHILIKRIHIDWTMLWKNYYIPLLAVLFVIGDKCLFIANRTGDVIPITLIKQCAVIVTILGGRVVFKEKNVVFKIMCAVVIICGILVGVK
ncbi:MAG: EamA family transporter [Clostridia bacterium]|nr:EamA family transporter [Clostridia bacterium]